MNNLARQAWSGEDGRGEDLRGGAGNCRYGTVRRRTSWFGADLQGIAGTVWSGVLWRVADWSVTAGVEASGYVGAVSSGRALQCRHN